MAAFSAVAFQLHPGAGGTADGGCSDGGTVTGGSTGGSGAVPYAENERPGGLTANVTVADTGSTALDGWNPVFDLPGDAQVGSASNAVAPGGTASSGFQGSWTGDDRSPTAFTLNGAACTAD